MAEIRVGPPEELLRALDRAARLLARGEGYRRLDPTLDALVRWGPAATVVSAPRLAAAIGLLLARRPGEPLLAELAAAGYRRLCTPMAPGHRLRLATALLLHGLLVGGSGRVALVAGALRGVAAAGGPGRAAAILAGALLDGLRGRPRAAAEAVRAGLAAVEGEGVWAWRLHAAGAAVALASGRPSEAGRHLRRMVASRAAGNGRDLALYHLLAAWRAVAMDDAPAAGAALAVARDLADRLGVGWFAWAADRLALEAAALEGGPSGGGRRLEAARAAARPLPGPFVGVAQRFAEARWGAEGGAEALRSALALARTSGVRLSWGQRPAALSPLLTAALADGVEVEEARRWIRGWRVRPERRAQGVAAWPWPVRIEALGRFRVEREGAPLGGSTTGPRRPLDLLRALVACGGREVRRERLADLLWPEAEGDAAARALATTLHRLRRLLGPESVVAVRDGVVGLDPGRCWLDLWAVEEGIAPLLAPPRRGHPVAREAVEAAEGALELYRGPLLHASGGESWLLAPRERLHLRMVKAVERIGRYWEAAGEFERAAAAYARGVEIDDLAEGLHQGLIRSWLALGRRADAVAAYRRLAALLEEAFGVSPAPESERLLRAALGRPPEPAPRRRRPGR